MQRGREPRGKNADELGVCSAAADERLTACHGGKNAGRACWVIAGTFCEKKVQGTFAQKYKDRTVCDFFKQVKMEIGLQLPDDAGLTIKLKVFKVANKTFRLDTN